MKLRPAIRCVAYDTFVVPPGESTHSGFAGGDTATLRGMVEIPEAELLARLLSRPSVRALWWEELRVPPEASYRLSVMSPFIADRNAVPGDIDILVASPASRYRAVALEAKRVKIRPRGSETESVTKIRGLAGGIHQANGLAKLGFSQTYLAIVVVSDVRHQRLQNFLCQHPSRMKLEEVIEAVDWQPLDEAVGVLWVEVPQGADRPLEEAGMVCVGMLREAAHVEQSSDLTERIATYMVLGRDASAE